MYFLEKKNLMKNTLAIVFVASLLCSTRSFAQGLGSIVGTVTDKSGAAVTAAKITVVESGTGATRDAEPDTQGYYVIPSLRPAQYSVSVRATGFRGTRQEVTLLADQTLTVNLALEVGTSTEFVTVMTRELQVDT